MLINYQEKEPKFPTTKTYSSNSCKGQLDKANNIRTNRSKKPTKPIACQNIKNDTVPPTLVEVW